MNHRISFLLAVSVCFLMGCKKDARPPEVTTAALTEITANSAMCGGEITSEGSAKVLESGLCWSTDHPPTISDARTKDGPESGPFSAKLVGLSSPATYYVRAYATNRHGTGYGEIRTFSTPYAGEYVTDYDGNVYHTVTIGTQVWLLENLKVTHFRNGVPLALQPDSASWYGNSYLPGYCYYNNDSAMIFKYGLLYNGKAVLDTNGLAPEGWHIASKDEFTVLINYLGGAAVAGGKLKEYGTGHWCAPNLGASNSSGFTALPGGRRVGVTFEGEGRYALFWATDPYWMVQLFYDDLQALLFPMWAGGSVRCIKD